MTANKNPQIKKANTEVEMTADDVINLRHCATDPIFFCENYVKIQHPTRGAIPFVMYEYQKDLVRMYKENRFSIGLSARQTGKCLTQTTTVTTIRPLQNTFINIVKKCLLRVLDKNTYSRVYG